MSRLCPRRARPVVLLLGAFLCSCNTLADPEYDEGRDVGLDTDARDCVGECVALCDSYCALMIDLCPAVFPGEPDCRAQCSLYEQGSILGDTLNCRVVAAAEASNDPARCDDAGPGGGELCRDGRPQDACEQICQLGAECVEDAEFPLDECIDGCEAVDDEVIACLTTAESCEQLAACHVVEDDCDIYCGRFGSCPEFEGPEDCRSWCGGQSSSDQMCLALLAQPAEEGEAIACDAVARTTDACHGQPCGTQSCRECLDNCDHVAIECPSVLGEGDTCSLACQSDVDRCTTALEGCGTADPICLPVAVSLCDQYCGLMRHYCPDAEVSGAQDVCLDMCFAYDPDPSPASADTLGCRLEQARRAFDTQAACEGADVVSSTCGGGIAERSCQTLCEDAIACGVLSPIYEPSCLNFCETDSVLRACWNATACPDFHGCGCNVFDAACGNDGVACFALGPRGDGLCLPGSQIQGGGCDVMSGSFCASDLVCALPSCTIDDGGCPGFCSGTFCTMGTCRMPCPIDGSRGNCPNGESCDPTTGAAVGVCVASPNEQVAIGGACAIEGEHCADGGICQTVPGGDARCHRVCLDDDGCAEGQTCRFAGEALVRTCSL